MIDSLLTFMPPFMKQLGMSWNPLAHPNAFKHITQRSPSTVHPVIWPMGTTSRMGVGFWFWFAPYIWPSTAVLFKQSEEGLLETGNRFFWRSMVYFILLNSGFCAWNSLRYVGTLSELVFLLLIYLIVLLLLFRTYLVHLSQLINSVPKHCCSFLFPLSIPSLF